MTPSTRPLALLALALALLVAPARAQFLGFGEDPVTNFVETEPTTPLYLEASWDPARTWVFAVGVLEWEDEESFSSFPQADRRDAELVDLLKTRGVPADQVTYLQDSRARTAAVRRAFQALLARTRPGDTLLVYFTGHGSRTDEGATYFATHDAQGGDLARTGWAVASIFEDLEAGFRGSKVLLTADCCYSGSLAAEVDRRGVAGAYQSAALTSSLSHLLSTGRWTFTECLIAGFRGDGVVDGDGDGQVRLDELAAYTRRQLALSDHQFSAFTTTPGFSPHLGLAVAQAPRHRAIGTFLEAESEGEWYRVQVVDVDAAGRYKIHYVGWEDRWDEWLAPSSSRLRIPGPLRHFSPGTDVEVLWKGDWYRARVLEAELGLHLVKYDDWDENWNEWVGPDRIRVASNG